MIDLEIWIDKRLKGIIDLIKEEAVSLKQVMLPMMIICNYKSVEEEILDEVKTEGGALGMKNLKDIVIRKNKETISDMKEEGVV